MALFIAALATIIVSGLFWRQFVVVRTIENQQVQAQSRMLLRGALDWARAILREDARTTSVDTMSEPWAQGLEETRLDQLGETSTLAAQASISGSIEDAQARLNLRNLVRADGSLIPREVDALRRLATLLSAPQQTADLIADDMSRAWAAPGAATSTAAGADSVAATNAAAGGTAAAAAAAAAASSAAATGGATPIPLVHPEDMAGIPGIDPQAVARLVPYVVVLDAPTPVDVNTATPEVIAARINGLSLTDAKNLAADRDRVPFANTGDLTNRLLGRGTDVQMSTDLAVTSRYFLVHGMVRLERATTSMEALVRRAAGGQVGPVDILWSRQL
jgi:general secretion pathway protein K